MVSPATARPTSTCEGPLIWYSVSGPDTIEETAAILACTRCTYLIVSGSFHDPAHAFTPVLREGLAG